MTDARLTVFCLHFLGGSARSWQWVAERLPPGIRCVTIDLPGFGDAAHVPGYAVAEMAHFVEQAIRSDRQAGGGRWMVAGHSMGAKLAAIVARHAEDGAPGLDGLARIVLVAGSPPSPEPMQDAAREEMKSWFAGGDVSSRHQADGYLRQNVGAALEEARHTAATGDVLRASRAAWLAWLDGGSREDWSDRVGVLRTPAIIVAGAKDGDLGPETQARLMAPHFSAHRLVTLDKAGHLLPLERPDEIAALLAEDGPEAAGPATMAAAYWALLQSDRVSAATRNVLLERLESDTGSPPKVLTAPEYRTLRALLARVLPQQGKPIDLAAALVSGLDGPGDGWRFAALPPDAQAYRAGLRTLDAAAGADGFAGLDAEAQDALLTRAAAGEFPDLATQPGGLDAAQMRFWFEDVRSEAVRLYVAHPATLARIGYSGVAYGGDGPRLQGFTQFGIGVREPWEPEPRAAGDAAP